MYDLFWVLYLWNEAFLFTIFLSWCIYGYTFLGNVCVMFIFSEEAQQAYTNLSFRSWFVFVKGVGLWHHILVNFWPFWKIWHPIDNFGSFLSCSYVYFLALMCTFKTRCWKFFTFTSKYWALFAGFSLLEEGGFIMIFIIFLPHPQN